MNRRKQIVSFVVVSVSIILIISTFSATAQEKKEVKPVVEPELLKALEYRMIGPNRGGRSSAVTGIAGDLFTYYMGTSGGGVWKTTDAGITWRNISDGFFGCGSIGAIAVAPSDENVIYVGTGETNPRGDIQTGLGIYKSTNAGSTWKRLDLIDAGNIGRIRIHPKDANIVYVAVLGHLFGPNEDRGVYRSKDGGATWEKVLYVSDKAGAVDLAMDPSNPRILYAAIWQFVRKPWTMISGGEDSGLYRSVDGGDNWEEVKDGIPKGIKGKIGITISQANPNRIWASIEAEDGGIFRSDDGGKKWIRISSNRSVRTRPFYYSTIYADPQDENTLYICNVGFHKSVDGGKTYERIRTPHGDHHDHWINPGSPKIMINGNDGGACVTFNGGKTWTSQMNQPTAEFYRVTTDNQYPYRVYGAQQDNSTISVSSRRMYVLRGSTADMYAVGGGEQGHIRVDPRDANIVYAGNYDGYISRYDHRIGMSRNIKVWPEMGVGLPAKAYKYRFQMNAPIRLSPHNPDVIYHCSQYVHRSSNQGRTWEIISPDLTRDDESKQEPPGGPITKDQAGGPENYCTIFAFEHSPHKQGLLWAGTDDGWVHISYDNGENWRNITPGEMPEWATVNEIELSPHEPGRAFLAVQRYRLDDFTPYIFITNDYGMSWKQLAHGNGIAPNHFARVVREDPMRKGLLYAGTEFGIYVSFDDGEHWQDLQLNLPRVQIADFVVKDDDLVIATHGRSFWILEGLSLLRNLDSESSSAKTFMFKPSDVYRDRQLTVKYNLTEVPEEEIVFEFLNSEGEVIRTQKIEKKAKESLKKGINSITWDLRYEKADIDEDFILWGFNAGPMAIPGEYGVRMTIGDIQQTESFRIKKDPRLAAAEADYQDQLNLSLQIRDKITELFKAVRSIRDIRDQVGRISERAVKGGYGEEIGESAKDLKEKLTALEERLIQTKLEASQDILNYPPKLLHQLIRNLNVVMQTDSRPNASSYERFDELSIQLQQILDELQSVISDDLAAFTTLLKEKEVPAVILPAKTEAGVVDQ